MTNAEVLATLIAVGDELKDATKKHGPFSSLHEAYAVILEELDEFWEEVRKKAHERTYGRMFKELIQVAAMAVRAVGDLNLLRAAMPDGWPPQGYDAYDEEDDKDNES